MLLTIKKVKELYDIRRITLINWEKERVLRPLDGTSFSVYDFWQISR